MFMNIVYFDVETQRSFDEVGGRHNIRKLGLSAAVTYSTADGAYRHYTEETVADLIAELKAADLVVGFNVLSFDYDGVAGLYRRPLGRHGDRGHAGSYPQAARLSGQPG